jgi:Lrp/AsnC family transcriptional regulator, leucine-responsive regulatory protein
MNELALDRIDVKILTELQQDASLTNVELAARVNLSPSPCLARVKNLERLNVIDRRIAVLDPSVLGFSVIAFIQIKLERQVQNSLENFTRAVERIAQVMECNLMIGDSDYLLRVVASDLEDLEDLIVNKLSRISGVSSIKSGVVLKNITHRTALPIDTTRPVHIKPRKPVPRQCARTPLPKCESGDLSPISDANMAFGFVHTRS